MIVGSLAAPHDPGLDELLGSDGARALRAELAARARRWAADVAPGRAFEATTLGAAEAALAGHGGPVLLAAISSSSRSTGVGSGCTPLA